MPFTTTIQAHGSPDAILASLREGLREWRESAIPADLSEKAVYRVEGVVERDAFSLTVARRSRPFIKPVLFGRVMPLATGQTEIVVRCVHRDYRTLGALVVLAILGFWNVGASHVWSAMFLFVAAASLGGIHLFQNSLVDSKLSEVRLLMGRLREVIERVDSRTHTSPPKPANER